MSVTDSMDDDSSNLQMLNVNFCSCYFNTFTT